MTSFPTLNGKEDINLTCVFIALMMIKKNKSLLCFRYFVHLQIYEVSKLHTKVHHLLAVIEVVYGPSPPPV